LIGEPSQGVAAGIATATTPNKARDLVDGYAPPSVGLLFAPRLTSFLAAIFSALTISDFLQIAYKAAEEKGLG
jgi:hypothetical protein